MRRTTRTLVWSVVIALILTLLAPTLATGNPNSSVEPELTPIAESFPTMFAENTDAPTLGELAPDGTIAVEGSPGEVTISVDPEVGISVGNGTATFGITSVGTAKPGISGNNVVVYEREAGDWATRPTGDGGVEIIEEVPADAPDPVYKLDLPQGTKLVPLDNGDVAVVRRDTAPDAQLAAAAEAINDAQDEALSAAIESLEATNTDSANANDLETALGKPVPAGVDELIGSAEGEVADDDGLEDLTTEDLAALAAELEEELDPGDYDPADIALVEAVELLAERVEKAVDINDDGEAAALRAAELNAIDEVYDAALTEAIDEETADEMAAELDIADPEAEIERSALALLEAQAEIGSGDRVEAIFSAPMSKALESGMPVATSLELVSSDSVAVVVPNIGETVVVDPWFIPVIHIVVRVAIKVVPKIVKAVQKASQQAKLAAEKAKAIKQAADKAARERLRLAAEQARRAAEAARVQAARAAQAAKQQAAQAKQQLAKQAQAAKQNAAKAAQKAKEATARAKAEAQKRAQEAAAKSAAKVKEVAKRATQVTDSAVKATIRAAQSGKGAIGAVADRVLLESLKHPLLTDFVVTYAVTRSIDLVSGPELDSCASILAGDEAAAGSPPTDPRVALAFLTVDVAKCIQSKLSDSDGGGSADQARSAYEEAAAQAENRKRTFIEAPANTPPGVEVVAVIAPNQVPVNRSTYLSVSARNTGPSVPLSSASLYLPEGLPHAPADTDAKNFELTDENGDGVWSTGELATVVMSVEPPLMRPASSTATITYRLGATQVSTLARIIISVAGLPTPAAPTGLAAKRSGSGAMTISWNKEAWTPSYQVELNSGTTRSTTTSPFVWSGLSNGTSYSFRVRGCDQLGCGAWSPQATGSPFTVPGTVAKPIANSLNNQVKLTWKAPATGGSAITKYEFAGAASGSSTGTSHTFSVGQDGGQKAYRVRACNAAGCGAWSADSSPVRGKVIAMAKGPKAPAGYYYGVKVYGTPHATMTVYCNDGQYQSWGARSITLDSGGYWASTSWCYSGYKNPHWVHSGSLVSNKVNF